MIHLARVRYLTGRFIVPAAVVWSTGHVAPGNSASPRHFLQFDRPASKRRCWPRSVEDIGSPVQTAAARPGTPL